MIRFLFLLLCFLIPSGCIFAQTAICGTDVLRASRQNNYSIQLESEGNEKLYQSVLQNRKNALPQGGVYTIPVVFHIMHNNGPENVADSVIVAAVEELNLRYQNSLPYFDSTGNAVNIQFCLATTDPAGNATTGITRTVTPFTNFIFPVDDQSLKNQVRWPPLLYYNVWVVFNISGFIDGYSSFPFYAGQSIDGVVIEYSYITNSYLLAHETAHYCGLYHTFQDGCPNLNCMQNGDQVCDTPPDNSSLGFSCMANSCSTEMQDTSGFNPFTSDVNELPNYMDYTTCPLSFTPGQAERMESSVSLFRSLLLQSNGCGANPGQIPPVAGFSYEVSDCMNGIVSFNDSNAVNSISSEWDFNNDGLYDTLAHTFSYTFPSTGLYTVLQRVSGTGGQDTISHTFQVYKGIGGYYPLITYPAAVADTIRLCQGVTFVLQADTNGVSYLWNTGDTTAAITLTADSSFDVSVTMIDSNGVSWSSDCTPLYIQVYEFNTPAITYDDTTGYLCYADLLTVYVVNPIPGTYTWQVYNISTGWFNTLDHNLSLDYYADPFNGSQFYVTYTNAAGCNAVSNTISVQPEPLPFLTGVQLTVNGYTLSYPAPNTQFQWYNNGVPVPGATSNQFTVTSTGCYNVSGWYSQFPACEAYTDTVCFLFSGMSENSSSDISLTPNPSSGIVTIAWPGNNNEKLELKIFSIYGAVLKQLEIYQYDNNSINVSDLPAGFYFFDILSGNQKIRKKILITKN